MKLTQKKFDSSKHYFNLAIMPITTDLADVCVLVDLVKAINTQTALDKFTCTLDGIALFPVIANAEILERENYARYRKSENGYRISRNIDFTTWVKARKPKRIALAVANFKDSINEIPDKYLSVENKIKLIEMIEAQAKTI